MLNASIHNKINSGLFGHQITNTKISKTDKNRKRKNIQNNIINIETFFLGMTGVLFIFGPHESMGLFSSVLICFKNGFWFEFSINCKNIW